MGVDTTSLRTSLPATMPTATPHPDGPHSTPPLSNADVPQGPTGPTSDESTANSVSGPKKRQRPKQRRAPQGPKLICFLCTKVVHATNPVWNCRNCFKLGHIGCVKRAVQAAAAEEAVDAKAQAQTGEAAKGSRKGQANKRAPVQATCPHCHHLCPNPKVYRCWCGSTKDPPKDPNIPPHSCGKPCPTLLPCGHPCPQVCHPGPCMVCEATVIASCPCGATEKEVGCGEKVEPCKNICNKQLGCTVHRCQRECHEGECDPCKETSTFTCHCGKGTPEAHPCTGGDKTFSCGQECGQPLACGHHTCSSPCHRGTCPTCPLDPSVVKNCPCGKTTVLRLAEPRTSCTQPIPTCTSTCGKSLPCSNLHKCPEKCHTGPCPPCTKSQIKHCRCGATNQKLLCTEVLTLEGTPLCSRKCSAMRGCGHHKCEMLCCPASTKRGQASARAPEHQCTLPCNKLLNCKRHKCQKTCHAGACDPCMEVNEQPLSCACGKTTLPGPSLCSTPIPKCPHPCLKARECGHTDTHICHEGNCPPCTHLVPKLCVGGHEEVISPCHSGPPSCGSVCNKPLGCGVHFCEKTCHKGECSKSEVCQRPCGRPLKCGHACTRPCHPGKECAQSSCKGQVEVWCKCKRQTKSMPCQKYRQTVTQRASKGDPLTDVKAVVDCDGECARLYRLHGLAEALAISGETTRTDDQKKTFEGTARDASKDDVIDDVTLAAMRVAEAKAEEAKELARKKREQDLAFQKAISILLEHRRELGTTQKKGIHKELSADKATSWCSRAENLFGQDGSGAGQAVILQGLTLTVDGKSLLEWATLKLFPGRRYALVGMNGVGKTTLLDRIRTCNIHGFPTHLRTWHVGQEVEGSAKTAMEVVLGTDEEREALLAEESELLSQEDPDPDALLRITSRLDAIGSSTAVTRATLLLKGLQFSPEMMNIPTSQLSGGWRMRVALAQGLFYAPDILMLDEPTNHLDLRAVLWLQRYLKLVPQTMIIVSHDRSFLDEVVTDTIHFEKQKLEYYPGAFSSFMNWRQERINKQSNLYNVQEKKRENLLHRIEDGRARAANHPQHKVGQVRNAHKKLEKLGAEKHADGKRWKWSVDGDRVVTQAVEADPNLRFVFPSIGGEIEDPPSIHIQQADFHYKEGEPILHQIDLVITTDTRLSVVGINGSGKSTLLKLILGQIQQTDGCVFNHRNPRVGYFSQHQMETLPLDKSPVQYLKSLYPDAKTLPLRTHLGSVGIHGDLALQAIRTLSGGQKARVVFSAMLYPRPHILLLDEPTNHLDYDTMDALAEAVQSYEGGVVVVSHDEHFVDSCCHELKVMEKGLLVDSSGFAAYKKALERELVENPESFG